MQYLIKKHGLPRALPWYATWAFKLLPLFSTLSARCTASFFHYLLRKQASSVLFFADKKQAFCKYLRKRKKENIHVNVNRLGEAILGDEDAEKRLKLSIEDIRHPDISMISVKISSISAHIELAAFDWTVEHIKDRLRLLFREAKKEQKIVNLDMEEYKDLHITARVFQELLSEQEFVNYTAGIALQSYIPDSYAVLEHLIRWAEKRNGAPIRIRLVKGANMAMERVEASIKGYLQAPFENKIETDANFKKMLHAAIQHPEKIHIGIASHNIFDIAYALVLREDLKLHQSLSFEMLEGMAPGIQRAIRTVAGTLFLYCPVTERSEFHTALAYLMRRLDENTQPDNFLAHLFQMTADSESWETQKKRFVDSFSLIDWISSEPRRRQNRTLPPNDLHEMQPFENEPDTDLSLRCNQEWAKEIIKKAKGISFNLPLYINGESVFTQEQGRSINPSNPSEPFCNYSLAHDTHIDLAIECAKKGWQMPVHERAALLRKLAKLLRRSRADLIAIMMKEVGKTLSEADAEVSEAIDFAELYSRTIEQYPIQEHKIVLVASPWNFPCSIAMNGILSSLAIGASVIFKPAQEAVCTGWHIAELVKTLFPKEAFQCIFCLDEPVGTKLIQDPRIDTVILTGSTETARHFLSLRPTLELFAETGGKNSMIVTSLADRDLAIRDIIHSSFSYAGQKCSACSVLILEKELYDDAHFLHHLADAAKSMITGSSLDLHLVSPGIKLGVRRGSFMHMTELFGPVLAVMRAENLEDALSIANQVPYGLTAGLHSLDPQEHAYWKKHIQAGNLYINRTITGAICYRQPFGGTKASSFGVGMKAGGDNYLLQLSRHIQPSLAPSISYFQTPRDPVRLIGQDNIHYFVPHKRLFLYVQRQDNLNDVLSIIRYAKVSSTPLVISGNTHHLQALKHLDGDLSIVDDLEPLLAQESCARIRFLSEAPQQLVQRWKGKYAYLCMQPPFGNERFDLLHFFREVSLSFDYHRYGNLGSREREVRKNML
jgi:RHH-type proline utilization regulon transcriptional repressor/proline dehydrogenase/delta 1-pyrroline-5-carboxylate dehydrogenase